MGVYENRGHPIYSRPPNSRIPLEYGANKVPLFSETPLRLCAIPLGLVLEDRMSCSFEFEIQLR